MFFNDGNGEYSEVTKERAPGLENIGMVTDAKWMDVNMDGLMDLLVVGEWMPITFFIQNEEGDFGDQTDLYLPDSPKGWWNRIAIADFTGNGLRDIVIGNLGQNYKYQASTEAPFVVYASDFDNSETMDIVLESFFGGDELLPVRGRSCSSEQIPEIGEKFPTFSEYAKSKLFDIYGKEDLESALKLTVTQFGSVILYQDSPGSFDMQLLPKTCQFAPVNDIVVHDVNDDGRMDLILAGNMYQSEIETGRADAGVGRVVLNAGKKKWRALEVYESGLFIPGDVKSLIKIKQSQMPPFLVAGKNNAPLQLTRFPEPENVNISTTAPK